MNKRNTEQKKIIKEALMRADHPTASELYEQIRGEYPRISRATVFRVLAQFADKGEIRRLELLGSDTRFDAFMTPHAHCHCVKCGRITDVYDDKLSAVLSAQSVAGYSVRSTEIEFNGVCPQCAQA